MGEPGLRRGIGIVGATTLVVGSAIGAGIFLLPAVIATQVGSPGLILAVWIVCGLLSLFGALTFAELGAMFPRAGGLYVFLREGIGRPGAFLYGWTWFWVISSGIIAAVATAFSLFVGFFFPALTPFDLKLVAIGCILFLAGVNLVGVRYGGLVSIVFTAAKVAAILALVVLAFTIGTPSGDAPFAPLLPAAVGTGTIAAFGLAMVAALFAYDGWIQPTFVAAEIENPRRNLPLAMILGAVVVMAVYVVTNLAYLWVLGADGMAATAGAGSMENALAAVTATRLLGDTGATMLAGAILVSTFGTVNAFVLAGPRVVYALAKDRLFYRGMASVHPRFGTPDFATIIQAEWSCLLVVTGSFTDLVNYSVFAMWLFYGVTMVGFFLLRRRRPEAPRPYRALGYPVLPALFLLAAGFIVVNTLVFDARNAGMALALMALGLPFYLWLERRRAGGTAPEGEEHPAS